jgi:hypothetical protein
MHRRGITMVMIRVVDKLAQLVYHTSGGKLGGKQLSYSLLCWLLGLSVLKHATQPRQAAQITRGSCCDYLVHPFLNKQ